MLFNEAAPKLSPNVALNSLQPFRFGWARSVSRALCPIYDNYGRWWFVVVRTKYVEMRFSTGLLSAYGSHWLRFSRSQDEHFSARISH